MSARMVVDLDQLDGFVLRLASFEEHLDDARAGVDRRLQRLGMVWSGVAAREHEQAHAHWRASAAAMTTALGQLRSIAATAHANYTSATRTNQAMWRAR